MNGVARSGRGGHADAPVLGRGKSGDGNGVVGEPGAVGGADELGRPHVAVACPRGTGVEQGRTGHPAGVLLRAAAGATAPSRAGCEPATSVDDDARVGQRLLPEEWSGWEGGDVGRRRGGSQGGHEQRQADRRRREARVRHGGGHDSHLPGWTARTGQGYVRSGPQAGDRAQTSAPRRNSVKEACR